MADVPERWRGTPAEPYWSNPEACRELIAEHGSVYAAAKVLDVWDTTLFRWAHPERRRRQNENAAQCQRRCYRLDPEWADRRRRRSREAYWSLSGLEYNRRLLQIRRVKALARMRERNRRREKEA